MGMKIGIAASVSREVLRGERQRGERSTALSSKSSGGGTALMR
jgi:hypothetical protein